MSAFVSSRTAPRPRPGWRIVAAKELADNVTSVRFTLLFVLVGLAGLASVHNASAELRRAAPLATEVPSIFLAVFTLGVDRIPSFVSFVAFLAPLVGIAIGFDAISAERSQRTLPRIVAQPLHRDDVLNGKLVGGLGALAVALVVPVLLVSGWAMLRIGLAPTGGDVVRLVAFTLALLLYVGLWLALAIAASVVFRRAATAALAVLGLWLVVTVFSGLLTGVVADTVRPVRDGASAERVLANAQLEQRLGRIAPNQVFEEIASATLNPLVRSTGIITADQVDRAVPAPLPADQSLLLVWPQIVGLFAAVVVIFAGAYVAFLRQEIRA